jgi:hypothetical protein
LLMMLMLTICLLISVASCHHKIFRCVG